MPRKLPDSIDRSVLIQAIREIDSGRSHNFADSTEYDVLFDAKRYPPKAVVGVAAEIVTGHSYLPRDFTGGIDSKCFRLLRDGGFQIVLKDEAEPSPEPFFEALRHANLTSHELELLRCHYNSPDRIVSSQGLADLMGISGGVPVVNMEYGTIARRIGEHLPWTLPEGYVQVGYLVTFPGSGTDYRWKMRPGFASALEELGIVNENSQNILAEEIESPQSCSEGARKTIIVNAYERSAEARSRCLDRYGYKCSVCDTLLSDVYGDVAEGLIHVHHLKPISDIGDSYQVDPIEDLRPVCPNCHAVIHRRRDPGPFSIDEARDLIAAHSNRQ